MTQEITQTRRLARQLMKERGEDNSIFNDRLADGGRSLKVWGWKLADYEIFAKEAAKLGMHTKIVERPLPPRDVYRNPARRYRIHVWE